jgi:hypothetical protein
MDDYVNPLNFKNEPLIGRYRKFMILEFDPSYGLEQLPL